jgi:hypothetical protein
VELEKVIDTGYGAVILIPTAIKTRSSQTGGFGYLLSLLAIISAVATQWGDCALGRLW